MNVQLTLLAFLLVFFWLWFSTRWPFLSSLLTPWQCFKAVFFDCTGVIIGLRNSVFFPPNECIDCIKSMCYCAVRRYAEKYWPISIFLIKEIKTSISMRCLCCWLFAFYFCMYGGKRSLDITNNNHSSISLYLLQLSSTCQSKGQWWTILNGWDVWIWQHTRKQKPHNNSYSNLN